MGIGLNLSKYQNVFYLKGDSEQDLEKQIRSLKGEFELLGLTVVGQKHVAWFNTNMKVVRQRKIKEDKNGSSN